MSEMDLMEANALESVESAIPSVKLLPLSSPGTRKVAGHNRVLIIYTGGTFGMVRDEADGALKPAGLGLTDVFKKLPELQHPDVPAWELIQFEQPLDSSDFTPDEWVKLANIINEHYYSFDGFVILHGTDTMAYSASALSFMLEGLSKPVIITGAQVPLSEIYNDAKRNLIVSILLAANFEIPEVCIFFNLKLYRGNRTKKLDSWGVDAFGSPNYPPLALTGTAVNLRSDLILSAPKRRFRVSTSLCTNIYVMQMIPGFDDSSLQAFASTVQGQRKGIVLALYGSGNAPTRRKGFLQFVRTAILNGVDIVVSSQCLRGAVELGSYATGSELKKMGLIDGNDMTIECAVTKLAYLIGKGFKGAELKALFESNLRGEVSDRKAKQKFNQSSSSLVSML